MPDADGRWAPVRSTRLLRLAEPSAQRSAPAVGLREVFLDADPADRDAALADACRRLVLPGLQGEGQTKAAALLAQLG